MEGEKIMEEKKIKKREKMTFAKNNIQAVLGIIVFVAFIIKVSISTYGYFINADDPGKLNIAIIYVLALIVTIIGLTVGIKTCIKNKQNVQV